MDNGYITTKYGIAKISTSGYRFNSPDVDSPLCIIPSNRISMKNVRFNVLGVDDLDNIILMQPEGEYVFEGSYVIEIPLKK